MTGISVVIPHYGDPGPTQALVGHLQGQVGCPDLQIIVSDDHSPEAFPQVAGVEVVRRATNGGFGAAVNAGAARAIHPLLMIINSDVDPEPTFVADLVAHLGRWPWAVLGPRVIEGGVPQVTTWRWPRVMGITAEWLQPLARYHTHRWLQDVWGADLPAHNADDDTRVDWLVGVCLLMPREAFTAAGGFDQRFFMNCEEIDLQKRLTDAGVPSVYVPTVELRHEGGGSSDPTRKSGWLVDARFAYHQKWGGAHRLLVGLTLASAVNAVWNTARRVAGQPTRPASTLVEQSSLVRHGWRARRGQGIP